MYPGFKFASAGILARTDMPASTEAAAVAAENGLCLAGHRSRLLREAMLREADIVLTMTAEHNSLLWKRYPVWEGKITRLGDAAGTGRDVPDPWRGGMPEYRVCYHVLKDSLERINWRDE
jgi:protein-tyrosine phosphatase